MVPNGCLAFVAQAKNPTKKCSTACLSCFAPSARAMTGYIRQQMQRNYAGLQFLPFRFRVVLQSFKSAVQRSPPVSSEPYYFLFHTLPHPRHITNLHIVPKAFFQQRRRLQFVGVEFSHLGSKWELPRQSPSLFEVESWISGSNDDMEMSLGFPDAE